MDAFEPTMHAPPHDAGYRLSYHSFSVAMFELEYGLLSVMLGRQPPLPEGVTYWDDLALLNSPHRVRAMVGTGRTLHQAWY